MNSAPICRCGANAERISMRREGVEIGAGYMCPACFDRALAEAAVLRDQFEALLAAGVSREEANRIMIARIDGKQASA